MRVYRRSSKSFRGVQQSASGKWWGLGQYATGQRSIIGLPMLAPYSQLGLAWSLVMLLLDVTWTAFGVPMNVAFCTVDYGDIRSTCVQLDLAFGERGRGRVAWRGWGFVCGVGVCLWGGGGRPVKASRARACCCVCGCVPPGTTHVCASTLS